MLRRNGPVIIHDSLGPFKPTTQMAFWSVQPLLHRWLQSVPILYNGTPLASLKLPLLMWGCGRHLIHGSLGPHEFSTQMTSRSIQLVLHGSLVSQTDRQTDRQTDHATWSVTIGCICVCSTVMQPNNNNSLNNNHVFPLIYSRNSVYCLPVVIL